jgi:opacity protein-like surface antigen
MFGGISSQDDFIRSRGIPTVVRACARRQVIAGIAVAVSMFAAAGAQAQNCVVPTNPNIQNLPGIGSSPASVTSMIQAAVTAADTAFLTQSEAFIGSPANPGPNQQGGGVWVRGVGGNVNITSSTATVVSSPGGGGVPATSSPVSCAQKVDESFAGVQFGADTARLNVNGWNLHFGATAGYLGTNANLVGGAFSYLDFTGLTAGGGPFTSTTQAPFFGAYASATYGGLAINGLLREQYYQTNMNAPGANIFGQNIDAHGTSFSGSVTYQWQVPDSKWFVEPSAGIIISRITVDPFNYLTAGTLPAVPPGDRIGGTLQLNDINSEIGRLGLRVGTTIDAGNVVLQPFGAVSVWHEFGPNITSTWTSCPGCMFLGATPTTATATSATTTFGTYGQYSLGISGLLVGTGWLGFARVDYRDGSNLQGLSGTGGIRYQFSPEEATRGVMPVKAPVYKALVMQAVDWTGFYVGAFGGATLGRADWGYAGGEVSPHVGGFIGGGDIGYNYETGLWVLGVEADLGKTNTNGGTGCGPLNSAPPGPMFEMSCNASVSWLGTATARVGYTWDRALLYVKAGGAWTDEQFSATCNYGPLNGPQIALGLPHCTNPASATSNGFTASTNRGGWVLGYGVEYALTHNWSAKAETDYISFGDTSVSASDGSALNVGMHLWQTTIGVNYRFNPGPVIASP